MHDRNVIDYNNGILLEKSTFKQQMILVFGGHFSLKCFFPFFTGGNYNLYLEMSKVFEKEEIENIKEDEVNDDENEPLIKKEKTE